MANLSDYTSSLPASNGEHIIQRFVTEAQYEALNTAFTVPLPTDAASVALRNANPNYQHTLYYVTA